jgi:hypothetical protein
MKNSCPNCGRNSIIGIHAGSTGKTRVLLHNYQCSCGYDTGNFVDDAEAVDKLKSDRAKSERKQSLEKEV